jgi:hypothetical protein
MLLFLLFFEATMSARAFEVLSRARNMNEIFLLEEAQAAYDRMMSGKARFRVVSKSTLRLSHRVEPIGTAS